MLNHVQTHYCIDWICLMVGGQSSRVKTRGFIDLSQFKHKTIKPTLELNVIALTNTIKQKDFNAYLVEYKDKIWVLESTYVQNNELLNAYNNKLKQKETEYKHKSSTLRNQIDILECKLDSLVSEYIEECTDSLAYYKNLKQRLPYIRDSLVLVEEAKKKEIVSRRYDEWYKAQPASTKRALDAIFVTYVYLATPNYAGGCDYSFHYINNSQKIIKYLDWTGTIYNAVNDPVPCDVRRTSICKGRDTGPIRPGESGGGTWECVIYNNTAKTMKLSNITILYMDGSSMSIGVADVRRLLKRPTTKVFINAEDVINKVISDERCEEKIDMWGERLNSLKTRDFKRRTNEDIFKDNLYDHIWKLLHGMQSELQNLENRVEKLNEEMVKFSKFINFE